MFEKIDELTDDEVYDEYRPRDDCYCGYYRCCCRKSGNANDLREEFNRELIPDRNYWANIVSHTYSVIAKKLDTVHRLEYSAMRTIAKEEIDFNCLPS